MGLLTLLRGKGTGSYRESAFDAMGQGISHLPRGDEVNDGLNEILDFDFDHPYASGAGLFLLTDLMTNGGEFTGQTLDAFLDNNGWEGWNLDTDPLDFAAEYGQIGDEATDVLFGPLDSMAELGKGGSKLIGGGDGNVAYSIFDGAEQVTEYLKDVEQVLNPKTYTNAVGDVLGSAAPYTGELDYALEALEAPESLEELQTVGEYLD